MPRNKDNEVVRLSRILEEAKKNYFKVLARHREVEAGLRARIKKDEKALKITKEGK